MRLKIVGSLSGPKLFDRSYNFFSFPSRSPPWGRRRRLRSPQASELLRHQRSLPRPGSGLIPFQTSALSTSPLRLLLWIHLFICLNDLVSNSARGSTWWFSGAAGTVRRSLPQAKPRPGHAQRGSCMDNSGDDAILKCLASSTPSPGHGRVEYRILQHFPASQERHGRESRGRGVVTP